MFEFVRTPVYSAPNMVHSRSGLLLLFLSLAQAKVYFKETFEDDWSERWTKSSWKVKEGAAGDWELTAGEWYGDAKEDRGVKTTPDARFYAMSAPLTEVFDNKETDLVVQFSVKHEQKIDCGGGYIKLFPESSKDLMEGVSGETPYLIMFGPDICGFETKKVHVILHHNGKNHEMKKDIKCKKDQLTHVYTLHIKPDNTYKVLIDMEEEASGDLFSDWSILLPKTIKDPEAKKPDDWDEEAKIADPEDKEPDGWDDVPEFIQDTEAKMPEDWDEDEDGEWEAPNILNPDYKGKWEPKMIDNPNYKGKWVAPDIDNPEYVHDDTLYHHPGIAFVGFELWQVKSGSIFDNIIVADDFEDAEKLASATFLKNREDEKKMYDELEKEKREKEIEERKMKEEQGQDDEYEDGIDAESILGDLDAYYDDEYEKDEL